jgi:transposase
MIGSPKPTSYESLMPPFVNPISSSPSNQSTRPSLRHVFADRVYRGPQLQGAIADCGPWTIQIVERPPGVKGFQLLPRRWVVERTFAWFGRSRRLAKDFEATIASPQPGCC